MKNTVQKLWVVRGWAIEIARGSFLVWCNYSVSWVCWWLHKFIHVLKIHRTPSSPKSQFYCVLIYESKTKDIYMCLLFKDLVWLLSKYYVSTSDFFPVKSFLTFQDLYAEWLIMPKIFYIKRIITTIILYKEFKRSPCTTSHFWIGNNCDLLK